MSPCSRNRFLLVSLLSVAAAALTVTGCTSGMVSSTTSPDAVTGPSFVVGTDAPLASVTSFTVQLQGINAIDASGKSVPLLSGTPTVDFARFNGLQTLLDMNDVPADTYDSINIVLGNGTIGYLDTSGGGEPALKTASASFTTSTISITLAKPLVIK